MQEDLELDEGEYKYLIPTMQRWVWALGGIGRRSTRLLVDIYELRVWGRNGPEELLANLHLPDKIRSVIVIS